MVAEKVTIETLSWKDGAKAVKWSCDGSPEYDMEECDKADRGTVITLYIADIYTHDMGDSNLLLSYDFYVCYILAIYLQKS